MREKKIRSASAITVLLLLISLSAAFISGDWLLAVVLGNFWLAFSIVINKIIFSGTQAKILKPVPYAFATAVGSVVAVAPGLTLGPIFGFLKFHPSSFWAAAAGTLSIFSLALLYWEIGRNETSRVTAVFASGMPIFTLAIKYLFLTEQIANLHLAAFWILVSGIVIISWPGRETAGNPLKSADIALILLSSLGFAASATLFSAASHLQGFISGIVWLSCGSFLAGWIIFFLPGQRRLILAQRANIERKNIFLFFADKATGESGSLLVKFALSLKSAVFVNACAGLVQFFVFILTLAFSAKYPHILQEELNRGVWLQKLIASLLILSGILLFSLG